MRKKITFYCDSMDSGGTEKATLDLVNNLSKEKYEITVVQLAPGGKYHKQLHRNIKCKEIIHVSPKKAFRLYWWARKIYNKIPIAINHKLFIGDKQDVEIACGYGYPTQIVAKSKKAKKISWIHMDVSLDRNYVSNLSREEGEEYFEGIDEFVCVSNDCAIKFNEKFGYEEKTKVCYNIVPADNIIRQSKENIDIKFQTENFNIISIGRLTWQKGFDNLINAIESIIKENSKIHLYIVGEGEDRKLLQNLMKDLNVADNIHLLGHVDNPYPLLKNADLYVCSSRHESFSLTVAESLILETPVISTRCTGPIELLENGKYGLLVDNNVSALRDGIADILENKEKLADLKSMACKRKEFFDIKKSIKKWETILDEK